jgi:RNA polymerase sigma-70 factor, ECF subfamily
VENIEIQHLNDLQKGNHRAFDYFFEKYYLALFAYANKILANSFVAEEIVQQMFISFWENREKINIHTSLKSYLFRSVRNDCLDYMKQAKRNHKIYSDEPVLNEPNVDFYDPIIETDFKKFLDEAFLELPEQCRVIFFLSRFEELSYKDIAKQQGISVKTVENQIGKTLKIIREKLQHYFVIIFL